MTEREVTLLKSMRSILKPRNDDGIASGLCDAADTRCQGVSCWDCPFQNNSSLEELNSIISEAITWAV